MQQPLCNRKTLNEIELEIGNSRLDSLAWLLRFFLSPSFSFPRQFFNLPLCEQMRTTCEAYLSHDSSQNPLFCGSSATAAKTAANFQLFGFSMMKIDHHHPSLPPEFQCIQSNLGGKWEKKKMNQRRKIIWDPIWREETLRFVNPDDSHIISFLL